MANPNTLDTPGLTPDGKESEIESLSEETSEALAGIMSAELTDDQRYEMLYNLGTSLLFDENLEEEDMEVAGKEAEIVYRRGLKLSTENTDLRVALRNNLGVSLMFQNKYKEAEVVLLIFYSQMLMLNTK